MNTDLAINYLAKVLSQIGGSMTPEGYMGHELGKAGVQNAEGQIQDIHYKEYKKEQEKKKKGALGGEIGGMLGGIALAPFTGGMSIPAAAAATGAGAAVGSAAGQGLMGGEVDPMSALVTGGMSAVTAGALGAAGNALAPEAAPAASGVVPVTGEVAPTMADATAKGLPSLEGLYKGAAPVANTATKAASSGGVTGFLSNVLKSPEFQSSITGALSEYTKPKEPVLSTAGLSPETAMALRSQVNQENEAAKTDVYRKASAANDAARLKLEEARISRSGEPKVISGSEPIMTQNGWGWVTMDATGNQGFMPAPGGYTPTAKPTAPAIVNPSSIVTQGDKLGVVSAAPGQAPTFSPLPEGVAPREKPTVIPAGGSAGTYNYTGPKPTGFETFYTAPKPIEPMVVGNTVYDKNQLKPGQQLPTPPAETRAQGSFEAAQQGRVDKVRNENITSLDKEIESVIAFPEDAITKSIPGAIETYGNVRNSLSYYMTNTLHMYEQALQEEGVEPGITPKIHVNMAPNEKGTYNLNGNVVFTFNGDGSSITSNFDFDSKVPVNQALQQFKQSQQGATDAESSGKNSK